MSISDVPDSARARVRIDVFSDTKCIRIRMEDAIHGYDR